MSIFATDLRQISCCVAGCLVCSVPFMILCESKYEDGPLRLALPSHHLRGNSMVSLSIMIPLVVDMVAETINAAVTGRNKMKDQRSVGILNTFERLLFLCGIAIVPMTSILPSTITRWAYICACFQHCQLTLVGGPMSISVRKYDVEYWPVQTTYAILSCLAFGSVFGASTDSDPSSTTASPLINSIQMSSIASILLSFLIFLFCSVQWFRVTIPSLLTRCYVAISRYSREAIELKKRSNRKELGLVPVIYVVVSMAAAILLAFMSTSSRASALGRDNEMYISLMRCIDFYISRSYHAFLEINFKDVQLIILNFI